MRLLPGEWPSRLRGTRFRTGRGKLREHIRMQVSRGALHRTIAGARRAEPSESSRAKIMIA
eukprot:2496829-Pyramimonas_sp.AAC.1